MKKECIEHLVEGPRKVLVCITIQQNSRRLIQKGAEIASNIGGEFHILHVEKGESIFLQDNAAQLVQELFEYASELGGEVHVICDDDVPKRIEQFIKENQITTLVLGKPMESKLTQKIEKNVVPYLNRIMQEIEVIVLEREEKNQEEIMIKKRRHRIQTSI
ncbi:MAG: universal stress protein [Epulopiscium sp.]|nr:universal stress protein [Candidatus Epulonipiscium sp.]